MSLRPQNLTLGVVLPAVGVTAALALWRHDDLATFRPPLRVAVETAAALIALLAAYLALGRLRRTVALDELLLVIALYVLAFSNFAYGVLPAIFGHGADDVWAWAVTVGQTVGAAGLAGAALLPVHRVGVRASLRRSAFAPLFALATTVAVGLVGAALPGDVATAAETGFEASAAASTLYVLGALLYSAAAVGFVRRAEQRSDELLGWIATGTGLAAVARLCYVVFPAPYGGWVQPGDLVRVLFYLALLVGVAREIGRYWRGLADRAVLEERRRIARDLHDGVAQELAFIVRRSRRLANGSQALQPITASAERALDDSRRAIAALTRPVDESVDVVIAEAAEEVAGRLGREVELDLAPGIETTPQVREGLVRIACEAVANAARHGAPSTITVELVASPRTTLRVVDDGLGFDPAGVRRHARGGFGLTSMRERAEAIGAAFDLRSAPGRGTSVEVSLP